MRKQIIKHSRDVDLDVATWLDLQRLARIELTSEDSTFPIEAALDTTPGSGWRAAEAGEQTIRLLFNEPKMVRRIQVSFLENQYPRTQEFVLRWLADGARSYSEIVRQQYTFSPPETTQELETYDVNRMLVIAIELTIVPNISGGNARASLAQLRIA
jgi:hypothetical protein